ncbi:MAG: diadenylate cyclase CdaA [bacterium]
MKIGLELFHVGFIKITVFDILDILVISYILYKLYYFIRGSRSAQMFVGLALILIVSLFARLFNMSGMTWIFDSLRTVWLIAFVIIFQPELRRMLIYLGQSRIIRYFVKVSSGRAFEEIVKSTVELTKRRYGGLIVLLRDTGLKSITETGVSLQAEVSAPLILSVFNPRSPLHDGALIIQNDIIVAARCILPLSENPKIEPSLGTRHRAAIGLSEESDAVIIVVSEERGTISVAIKGELHQNLNVKTLRNMIHEAFKFSTSHTEQGELN